MMNLFEDLWVFSNDLKGWKCLYTSGKISAMKGWKESWVGVSQILERVGKKGVKNLLKSQAKRILALCKINSFVKTFDEQVAFWKWGERKKRGSSNYSTFKASPALAKKTKHNFHSYFLMKEWSRCCQKNTLKEKKWEISSTIFTCVGFDPRGSST